MGKIEVGKYYVRLYNRTSDRTVILNKEQYKRWKKWLKKER